MILISHAARYHSFLSFEIQTGPYFEYISSIATCVGFLLNLCMVVPHDERL